MTSVRIAASLWRGGTSRGLLLRAGDISKYSPVQRDAIVYTALGTPDPMGRQIDGLGGGASSLSKVAIVGLPGEGKEEQRIRGLLPGVDYADDAQTNETWDVVYRFGQVSITQREIDWTASCGNLLSAVAIASVESILPRSTIISRSRSLPSTPAGEPLMFPISILSASNGVIMKARVPLDPITLQLYEPAEGSGCAIAGVPGEAAGIVCEMPLSSSGSALVTGRVKDIVLLDGIHIPISFISAGLPNIFVTPASLNLPPTLLASPLSTIGSESTMTLLERVRVAAAQQFSIPLSLASPKIILVSSMAAYTTTGGDHVLATEGDLLVRSVSSGQIHATIPGTTLAAINVAAGLRGSVVADLIGGSGGEEDVVTVRAAHAAGVASSSARFIVDADSGKRRAESVVLMRTAREIMRGEVLIPRRVLE